LANTIPVFRLFARRSPLPARPPSAAARRSSARRPPVRRPPTARLGTMGKVIWSHGPTKAYGTTKMAGTIVQAI